MANNPDDGPSADEVADDAGDDGFSDPDDDVDDDVDDDGEPDGGSFRTRARNQGQVCVGTGSAAVDRCAAQKLDADKPLAIAVDLGCDPQGYELDMGCKATLDGDQILVESWLRLGAYDGEGGDDACFELRVECSTPALAPGKYTIVHGDQELSIEVGAVNQQVCDDTYDQTVCCANPDDDGSCVPEQSSGDAYAECESTADCGINSEYCLGELNVCMAPCQADSDCEPSPSDGVTARCLNYDGVTDDFSCVLDCTEEGAQCPAGMACVNGLFCSPGEEGGAAPQDGPCERESDVASASCDNGDGNYYDCQCRYSTPNGDGASGSSVMADSCEAALDAIWCAP